MLRTAALIVVSIWLLSSASAAETPAACLPVSVAQSSAKPCITPGSGEGFKDCPDCPEMVVIPAGSFTMGSPESEEGRSDKESPQHEVRIPKPFAAGRFAVTYAEWDACVDGGGCGGYRPADFTWGRGNRPVLIVSWDNAKAYTAWLSSKTGKQYRLLTEAEREYVTRAGTTGPFWWGSSISAEQANYGDTPKHGAKTVPVNFFKPNPWGLYQVHGNVHEWTEDCLTPNYRDAPSDGTAGTGNCSVHVIRGGSWNDKPGYLRAAARGGCCKGGIERGANIGFRVARTLD